MINLLPPDLKESRLYGRRNIKMLTYSVAVLIIGAACITILLINFAIISNDKRKLNTEIAEQTKTLDQLKADQKDIDTLASRLATVNKIYTNEVRFSTAIPKIGALIPAGVRLKGLSLTGNKSSTSPLQLDIEMQREDLAAVFYQNLINSDVFEAVDINNVTPVPASKTGYTYISSLVVAFRGTAAAKKAAAAAAAATAAAAQANGGTAKTGSN